MSGDDHEYPRYKVVDGFTIPESFSTAIFRDALKYQPEEGDLFLATFPKCGTTWTQMIIHLLYHDGREPTDTPDLFQTTPFLEMFGREAVERRRKPGAVKAHLPYNLIPYSDKAKYIFVIRNPKDACVSFFHHTRLHGYCFENGKFDTFFDIFVEGNNDFGEYFDFVLSWYNHRNDPNVLIVYFELMKKNIRKEIGRIADFIDPEIGRKTRDDPEFLERVVSNSNLSSMKKLLNATFAEPFASIPGGMNADLGPLPIPEGYKHFLQFLKDNPYAVKEGSIETVNKDFIRKGLVGDWKTLFSDEQNERMNRKIEEKLKGTEFLAVWKEEGCL